MTFVCYLQYLHSWRFFQPWILLQILIVNSFFSISHKQIGFFQPNSRNTLYGLYKEFLYSYMWFVFSLMCSSRKFMYALLYTRDWVNHHQNNFHQIVLCLNAPKINHSGSDSQSLNQIDKNWVVLSQSAFLPPSDHLSAGMKVTEILADLYFIKIKNIWEAEFIAKLVECFWSVHETCILSTEQHKLDVWHTPIILVQGR